jgi:dihydroorotate dehydrogenase (NAD+) catalytic subunit
VRNGAASDQCLALEVAALRFQNPVLLAAGTAAYGRELSEVVALDRLGGIVTKAVSVKPKTGAPSPRVADFPGGMINAIGLANPGVEAVRTADLPWLATHLRRARVLVNVVGDVVEEYGQVVARLDGEPGVDGYELNVSCPNVKAGGMEFGADPGTLAEVVRRARAETSRPLFVKLAPSLPDIAGAARTAVDAGANGITLVNTIPGLVIDVERRRPLIGYGSGGVSGPGLLPVGVLATWKVRQAVDVPLIGVGGIGSAEDALQYMLAGASLVAIGTAALADPRTPERVVHGLGQWCRRHSVDHVADLVGTLEWRR